MLKFCKKEDKLMTLNTIFLFLFTIVLLSSLYNRFMLKVIKRSFLDQDDYKYLIDFGIDKFEFNLFKLFKILGMKNIGNLNIFYKILRIYFLFLVLLSISGYVFLFIVNSSSYGEFLRFKL